MSSSRLAEVERTIFGETPWYRLRIFVTFIRLWLICTIVLLRLLEYYDGILILTTNRMRSFDIAVQSRIRKQFKYLESFHCQFTIPDIAVKYEDLSKTQQVAIFEYFLEQLNEKNLVHDINDLKRWVAKRPASRMNLNGRQIRNIVSTALGLAMMDNGEDFDNDDDDDGDGNGRLRRKHLIQVTEQTMNFKAELHTQEEMSRMSQKSM